MTSHPDPASDATPSDTSGRSPAWKTFGVPALIALAGYILFYSCDAHLRVRRGPWEVTFLQEPDGTPAMVLRQPALGIDGVTVRFPGERPPASQHQQAVVTPAPVRFSGPDAVLPFGTLAFHDLMYLPGTVVIHCFGHEVQMLPRALYLNRKEVPWSQPGPHTLQPADRLPSLDPPPRTVLGRPRKANGE